MCSSDLIEKAAEAGGILEQAATSEHQRLTGPEGREHPLQAASVGGGHGEAIADQRFVPGGHHRHPISGKLLEQGLEKGVIAEVVLAVVAAEQHPPAAAAALTVATASA